MLGYLLHPENLSKASLRMSESIVQKQMFFGKQNYPYIKIIYLRDKVPFLKFSHKRALKLTLWHEN